MTFQKMACAALAVTLLGCGDKKPEGLAMPDIAPVSISLNKVETPDDAASQAAFEMLFGFLDTTEGLSYANLSGEKGHYVIDDLEFSKEGAASLFVDEWVVTGLTMNEDAPVLAGAEIRGLRINFPDDEGTLNYAVERATLNGLGASYLTFLDPELWESGDEPDFGPFHQWDFGLDGVEIVNSKSTFKLDDQELDASLGQFVLTDMNLDGLGAVSLRDHKIDAKMDHGQFSYSLERLDFRDLYVLYLELAKPKDERRPIREIMEKAVESKGLIQNFRFEITSDEAWAKGHMDNFEYFSALSGDVATTVMRMSPLNVDWRAEGPNGDEINDVMDRLGIDDISFTMGALGHFDFASDRQTVDEFFYQIADVWRIDMTYDVAGMGVYSETILNLYGEMFDAMIDDDGFVDFDRMSEPEVMENMMMDDAEALRQMQDLKLYELAFNLTDLGIVERGIALAADEQDTTDAVVRNQMKSAMGMSVMAAETPQQADLAMQLSAEAAKIVDGTANRLTIGLFPEKPLSYDLFKAYIEAEDFSGFDWDLLGIKIEAN